MSDKSSSTTTKRTTAKKPAARVKATKPMPLTAAQKLQKIQLELKAPKNQYNKHGKYNYRSAEDILEALKPFMEKYNVSFISREELKEIQGYLFIETEAIMIDLDSDEAFSSPGNAIIEMDAKGMHMPQRTGAAGSYAKKYAYGNLLQLDDTKDSDATNQHGNDARTIPTATKPELFPMTDEQKTTLLNAISAGKAAIVVKKMDLFADSPAKKEFQDMLAKIKKS